MALLAVAALATACGSPVEPASDGTPWVDLTMGDGHGCVLDAEGRAACWGANLRGQLGIGSDARPDEPAWVRTDLRFAAIDAGAFHTCAVTLDGRVFCWGANESGQLGTGDFGDRDVPVAVQLPGAGWASVSAGFGHSCAVRDDGLGVCWGRNDTGQLGLGLYEDGPFGPGVIEGEWRAIEAGWMHSCGIRSEGGADCWGANGSAQLGTGLSSDATAPSRVPGALTFAELGLGDRFSCGLTVSGEVWCWGGAEAGFPVPGAGPGIGTPARAGLSAGLAGGLADAGGLATGERIYCAAVGASALTCRSPDSEDVTVPWEAPMLQAGLARTQLCVLLTPGDLECIDLNVLRG